MILFEKMFSFMGVILLRENIPNVSVCKVVVCLPILNVHNRRQGEKP